MTTRSISYAGPSTPPRPGHPMFVVPARVSRCAAGAALLCVLAALPFFHDHMIVRSYQPRWRQVVTPAAVGLALPLAAVALLRDRNGRRGAAGTGSVAMLLSVACLMWMALGPRLIVCGETADRVKCASNLRQVGQALLVYSMANAGALPPDLATVSAHTEITTEAFVCPLSRQRVARGPTTAAAAAKLAQPAHCSYIYLPRATLAAVMPVDVLAYEPAANHGGAANVLFGDGHVAFLTGKELAALLPPAAATTSPGTATSVPAPGTAVPPAPPPGPSTVRLRE